MTVAICTRNRAESLRRTLSSITHLAIPHGITWEVLVIDNGSTDSTEMVVASYESLLPIRTDFEGKTGLSNARNRAFLSARGAYIVWTDDDVIVDPGWLVAYVAGFERWSDGTFFGGMIIPDLEQPIPAWLSESWPIVAGLFGSRDLGNQAYEFSLDRPMLPFGGNFALKAADLPEGPFDPRLGAGTPLGSSEETALMLELLHRGKKGYWLPDAKIFHRISRKDQTVKHIRDYSRSFGRSDAYLRRAQINGPRLFGVPRFLWRRTLSAACRYHWHRIASSRAVWMQHLVWYAQEQGALEYFRTRVDQRCGSAMATSHHID